MLQGTRKILAIYKSLLTRDSLRTFKAVHKKEDIFRKLEYIATLLERDLVTGGWTGKLVKLTYKLDNFKGTKPPMTSHIIVLTCCAQCTRDKRSSRSGFRKRKTSFK